MLLRLGKILKNIPGPRKEILKNICSSERNLKERWPRREILKNTGASERNSEEYRGLGEKF
jgi:hypothetical protein